MKTIALAVLIACLVGASAFADPGLPAIVTDGLSAYQKSGSRAAMLVWLKNAPAESDTSTIDQWESLLSELETIDGKMIGFEVIRTLVFSPSSERIYLLIKLEKGPVYAALDCYRAREDWTISIVAFNTKPERVLPEALFDSAADGALHP